MSVSPAVAAFQRERDAGQSLLHPDPIVAVSLPSKSETQESLKGAAATAARVWTCAHVLAGVLHEPNSPVDCRGLHVLEVGAGCGLVGLSATRAGAASVCLTDLEENLPILQRAVAEQQQQRQPPSTTSAVLRVEALDWMRPLPAAFVDTPVDLVLGADVVYWPALMDPLLNTLAALPGSPRTLLCIENRFGCARDFARRAEAQGWQLEALPYRDELLPASYAEEARGSLFPEMVPGPMPELFELVRSGRR